jgi:hypothetical protein
LFAAWEFSVSSDTTRQAPPTRQAPAAPSWRKVIGTTLRLWVRRRVLHIPDSDRIGTGRLAAVAAVVTVVVVAAAVAVTVGLTGSSAAPGRGHHATAPRRTPTPAQRLAKTEAAAQAAANGKAAATWVAAQVSAKAVLGCDPITCAVIVVAGYQGGGQITLQPGVSLPAAGSLIVATSSVRALYGAQLNAAAPVVVAAFGTGPQSVQVRLVTPGGQAAYSASASARRAAGRKLIAAARVHVHAGARADLTAGLVDSRLLTVLRRVAAHYPLDIYRFADTGPGADSSMPFRLAEIIGLTGRHKPHQLSELAAVERLLRAEPPGYRAALVSFRMRGGRYGLKIEFLAPSPF